MRFFQLFLYIVLCISSALLPIDLLAVTVNVSSDVNISAFVNGCGDNVIAGTEQCDGSNLGGASCALLGYNSGIMGCSMACTFDTSNCRNITIIVPPSGGGGGGGSSQPLAPINPLLQINSVVFSGMAYPNSRVTLLKDGQVSATTVADAKANFQITLSGLSTGNYNFNFYSEDLLGLRSTLLTFPISVTEGVTIKVANIFIAPTINLNKQELKHGDNLVIFGNSSANSEITITVNSAEEIFKKITSDDKGYYLLNFDTSVLENGQHHTKSKASLGNEVTSYSKTMAFVLTDEIIKKPDQPKEIVKGNVSGDGKVNLLDFSIIAFWYKQPLDEDFLEIEKTALNGDGKIDLIDFSIMAYHWTG